MPRSHLIFCFALFPALAQGGIHKCRQGERVIYQEQPCAATSQTLGELTPAAPPAAFEADAARLRAASEASEVRAIRKQEQQAAARADKHEKDCDRLLEKIEKAQEKKGKASPSDTRKYRKECGEPPVAPRSP